MSSDPNIFSKTDLVKQEAAINFVYLKKIIEYFNWMNIVNNKLLCSILIFKLSKCHKNYVIFVDEQSVVVLRLFLIIKVWLIHWVVLTVKWGIIASLDKKKSKFLVNISHKGKTLAIL